MAENDWWFRSEANWKYDPSDTGVQFEKIKLSFIAEAPEDTEIAQDFKTAESKLKTLIDDIADPNLPINGALTEKGLKIRHGIFTVSKSHPG